MTGNNDDRGAGGYVICASPRSGSTLLCDLLDQTGIAGTPKSYFRPDSIREFVDEKHRLTDPRDWDEHYLAHVRSTSITPNGCFAFRIMWNDMPPFLQRLETLYPETRPTRDRLRDELGIEHFIHLYREDKVAQAVSLVIAQQTGTWHVNADGSVREGTPTSRPAHYDHNVIEQELGMLEDEHHSWTQWFKMQDITPITVSYESLSKQPVTTVESILQAVGLDGPHGSVQPQTSRIATKINDDWATAFRRTINKR